MSPIFVRFSKDKHPSTKKEETRKSLSNRERRYFFIHNCKKTVYSMCNHGLHTLNEAFFLKSQTFGLGQIHFGAIGVFSADLSAPILVL
jgi:hypothetical protein